MPQTKEAITFRHMIIRFDDGSTRRYVMQIPDFYGKDIQWINAFHATMDCAALELFRRLRRKGRNYGDPFIDKRICREPGPKATAIISIWDGDEKSSGDSVAEQRAALAMTKV